MFETGQNKRKACPYILEERECPKLVRTGEKRVLIYWKKENVWNWSEQEKSVFLYTGRKRMFETGQNRRKACPYILEERECLKLVRTREKCVLIYWKKENVRNWSEQEKSVSLYTGRKRMFETGQNRRKACPYRLEEWECLKLVRTREKRVLIYRENENVWNWSEQEKSVSLYTGRKRMFETGQKKRKACPYILEERECLKLVRTREKRVLIYWKKENVRNWSEEEKSVSLYTGRKRMFETGQNKRKACPYILEERECLKLVRTGEKRVLIYWKKENVWNWSEQEKSVFLYTGRKRMFETGQNKRKACSYILEERECNPLFVSMDTSCKLHLKRDNIVRLRASNSLVDYQIPRPPLKPRVWVDPEKASQGTAWIKTQVHRSLRRTPSL